MGSKHLQPEERDELARLHAQGLSVRELARRLGRSPSTISTELRTGSWHDDNRHTTTYVAIHAQRLSEKRAQASHQPTVFRYDKLAAYIRIHIQEGWSPEQVAGRLLVDFPDDTRMRVSHETIYAYIYDDSRKDEKLWEYLPRKQKKRRKQTGRSVKRSHIPDRVSIHDRPAVVNERTQFGHWEGDTVEGQRSKKDGIHTEVERMSGYLAARKVVRITAAETAAVMTTIFEELPPAARRSSTYDNGKENYGHAVLHTLGMDTYFADPYCSGQRGTNENTNGLLRRYLPKQTDFTTLSPEELADIVAEINNRPRKRLGYATPNEVFLKQLK